MYRGKIAGLVDAAEATPELLGYMMATGNRPAGAAAELPSAR
jgi:hypothetical protein